MSRSAVIGDVTEDLPRRPGLGVRLRGWLARWRLGAVGLAFVAVWALVALFSGVLATDDPTTVHVDRALVGPTLSEPFGTDYLGRDMWSRLVYGARYSLLVALCATGLGTLAGLLVGLVSGYAGGYVDLLVQRAIDVMQALPILIVALAVVSALGPSLPNVMAAIAFPMVSRTARVLRATVLQIKTTTYVEAARASGAGPLRIMLRHVLPNGMAPVAVLATAQIGSAILTEAALGFLGLGVPPPTPTWGGMLSDAARFYEIAPWTAIYPGLAITLAVLAVNLVGDALRDAWDPRMRNNTQR